MFLVYEGDKQLVINGYIDASFDTDPDDSKSQFGYIFLLNGGAVSWCRSKQSIVAGYIEICKIHTDLNVADPLTKPLPRAKHDHTLVLFGY